MAKNTDIETRMTVLESEFRTELKHLATKADLSQLELRLYTRLGGMIAVATAVIIAAMRFWQ